MVDESEVKVIHECHSEVDRKDVVNDKKYKRHWSRHGYLEERKVESNNREQVEKCVETLDLCSKKESEGFYHYHGSRNENRFLSKEKIDYDAILGAQLNEMFLFQDESADSKEKPPIVIVMDESPNIPSCLLLSLDGLLLLVEENSIEQWLNSCNTEVIYDVTFLNHPLYN